jgi:predicted Zn-ribbon and HTH transcriptional regulator
MTHLTLEKIQDQLNAYRILDINAFGDYSVVITALEQAEKIAKGELVLVPNTCDECKGRKTIAVIDALNSKYVEKPCACCFKGLKFNIPQPPRED